MASDPALYVPTVDLKRNSQDVVKVKNEGFSLQTWINTVELQSSFRDQVIGQINILCSQ